MIQHDILIKKKNAAPIWVTGIFREDVADARRDALELERGEVIGSKSYITRNGAWELFLERGVK